MSLWMNGQILVITNQKAIKSKTFANVCQTITIRIIGTNANVRPRRRRWATPPPHHRRTRPLLEVSIKPVVHRTIPRAKRSTHPPERSPFRSSSKMESQKCSTGPLSPPLTTTRSIRMERPLLGAHTHRHSRVNPDHRSRRELCLPLVLVCCHRGQKDWSDLTFHQCITFSFEGSQRRQWSGRTSDFRPT